MSDDLSARVWAGPGACLYKDLAAGERFTFPGAPAGTVLIKRAGGWYTDSALTGSRFRTGARTAVIRLQAADAAPAGCGRSTRVAGTNGGLLRCGAVLRELDGREQQQYCAACQQAAAAQS